MVILGLIPGASCKKQLDTNLTNPNGVGINLLHGKDLFAGALSSTATNKIGANLYVTQVVVDNYDFAQQWLGYWSRNTGYAPSGSQGQMENFNLINSFSNNIWQTLYHNIYDFNFVIANSSANSILPGASRVMRAMVFQDLVDIFGNIPYSQASQPLATIRPSYDDAATIYKSLITQLDSAITAIKASSSTADDVSDVMFKGNKVLWVQFANSLKLRILLRQVPKGDQTYVQTELSKITAEGSGFLPQDAAVNPGYADAVNQQNPFWAVYGFQPASSTPFQNYIFFIANNFMLGFLQDSTVDPRIGYFYTKNANGTYGGNPFGATPALPAAISSIGTGILKSAAMPAVLLSGSQILFMQAEAVQRGLLPGSYQTLYKQAVEASFTYLGVPNAATAADNFISTSPSKYANITGAGAANPLQTILYQKWVSECELDGLEAWSDYRRTGYPNNPEISYSVGPGVDMPKRLLYPQTEYDLNNANVMLQNQQATDLNTALFWGR